ncbi:DUF4192 domain-containing protein [Corynebacterium sp. NML130628]|uniref:DUF4192 domain-containing protein n=1 Tax=Corynebacterium sp. NML130628 TaxID=1906333 RepID=UPI0008FB4C4B|nr:DUF4192 domain-containing protein [Corynebacterium sp. NML130628]OIR46264.1 hypothetical protein BJP07_01140 [Corynebacterium sp. NML130628]
MSTHSHTLASHGEILANLPGILGFYPNNSLILAFFVDDEGVDTVRLGPVARFDLDEAVAKLTESRERFAAWVHHLELDAVIAYMISDDIAQPVFEETATYLTSGAVHLPPLLGVVQVPEIVTGAAWWSVYQHPLIDEPRHGVVGEVAASAALRQMLEHTGELPEPSKDDIEARLNSTDHGIDAAEHADIIEDALAYVPPIFRDVLQREYEQAAAGMTQPSARAIRSALKCFTTPRLRDPLLAALLEEPQAGLKFAEQVMRAVPAHWPGMRAQLTATVAVLAQANGQTGLAGVAAHRATEISSKETFPSLVAKLIDIGEGSRLAEVVHEGGAQARVQLFEN